MRIILRAFVALSMITAIVAASGCGGSGPEYVDQGRSFTQDSAMQLLDESDAGEAAKGHADEAAELRHTALTRLRAQGGNAAKAATLITKTLPTGTRGVPFYVEKASYESTPAIIILEATGRPDGPLEDRRIWVLGEDGTVLLAGTGRR